MRLGPLLLSALLIGCAATSATQIRADHAGAIEVEVQENYQSVFRRVADRQRACWSGNAITAHTTVEANIYNELRQGEITFMMVGGFGPQVYVLTDIEPADRDGYSRATIYYSLGTYRDAAEKTAAFIRGDASLC